MKTHPNPSELQRSDGPRRFTAARAGVMGLVGLLLCGCGGHTEYVIEMEPEGGTLNRKLSIVEHAPPRAPEEASTAEAEPPPKPADAAPPNVEPEGFPEGLRHELARVEALYATRHSNYPSNTHAFQGSFSGEPPNDVGGAGSFLYCSNSLGTASVYVERFRGNDDPAGRLQQQARAIDLLVDHLIAWCEQEPELGAQTGFDKLRVFFDQNLRRDLKNVGLYTLRSGALSRNVSEEDGIEGFFRVGLYLLERGYFTTGRIPELMRWFEEDEEMASLRVVQRLCADKMGILPHELSIFENPEALEKSGVAYLKSTPDYRELLKAWEIAKQNDPELERPEPDDVIEKIAEPLTDWFVLFRGDDKLKLSLSLKAPPLHSNGEWDGGKLVWERNLEGDDATSAPVICYATWVSPNAAAQRRLFGETILAGETLLEACLQFAGLNEIERRDLDAALNDLPPPGIWKPQFDALRAEIKAEALKRGDPIHKDEFSSQAWERVRSKLPEPFGEPK